MSDNPTSQEDQLARAIATLSVEFQGVFSVETVERCVRDSFRELAHRATVDSFVGLLAQRFARERLLAAQRSVSVGSPTPGILFVCTHNSGRSQIAAAWVRHLAPDIDVWSAGSDPAHEVSPIVARVMEEVGITLSDAFPKPLTDEVIAAADVVITMGCGEACPVVPGRRYEDWDLVHQPGSTEKSVRAAREEIRERVEALVTASRTQPA
jgi:protein-tyrosine-phosphatase